MLIGLRVDPRGDRPGEKATGPADLRDVEIADFYFIQLRCGRTSEVRMCAWVVDIDESCPPSVPTSRWSFTCVTTGQEL